MRLGLDVERFRRLPHDQRVAVHEWLKSHDLWGIGVTLYELVGEGAVYVEKIDFDERGRPRVGDDGDLAMLRGVIQSAAPPPVLVDLDGP